MKSKDHELDDGNEQQMTEKESREHDLFEDNRDTFAKLSRKLKRNEENIFNRLKSIEDDKNFVSRVIRIFEKGTDEDDDEDGIIPSSNNNNEEGSSPLDEFMSCGGNKPLPILANLRCGLWYYPCFDGTCYFKSTDGHTYHWDFSFSRLNLHVLNLCSTRGGVFIVDSTRKGKRFPDALSKTIPIWACVINRAIAMYRQENQQQHLLQSWDSELHTPQWIPDTERSQIAARIDQWAKKFMTCGVDMSIISSKLSKPLRCLWIGQSTNLYKTFTVPVESLSFIPLILISASDPERPVKASGWMYIQGAGDDHESWSMGLSPKLFWEHAKEILTSHDSDECEQRVKRIVVGGTGTIINDQSQRRVIDAQLAHTMHQQLKIHEDMSSQASSDYMNLPGSFVEISNTGLYPVSLATVLALSLPPNSLATWLDKNFDAVLNCSSQDFLENSDNNSNPLTKNGKFKWIDMMEDKKNKFKFENNLPRALGFIHAKLSNDSNSSSSNGNGNGNKRILIICHTGNNESIGVCLAALEFFYSDKYEFIGIKSDEQLKKASKQTLRKSLAYVQTFIHTATPSRSLMQQLNRFFCSSSIPRLASDDDDDD